MGQAHQIVSKQLELKEAQASWGIHTEYPALHCAEGAGPQARQCFLIPSEKSRDKRQRLRGRRIFDLWGPDSLLLFIDSWVPLIPKHILLLLQLVNLGFQSM